MEFRRLGNSGLKVSEISFGNWLTHGSQVDEDTARATVLAALDAGVSTFDTADVYAATAAESVLGRALAGVRRESLEIFTKVYWPTGAGPNDRGLSRKHIMESCHASLKRLGTDYVDLYQAHRWDYETPLEETLRAFDDLVRQGKVLYIGVSEWTAEEIAEAHRLAGEMGFDKIVSNQPQYSMLWRVIEPRVVPTCQALGVSQIVWSPIAQGVLTGKYLPGQPPPPGSRATHEPSAQFIQRFMKDEILASVQNLKPIANDLGLTMGQLAIAWVLANPNVASAIVGSSKPEHMKEAVGAVGVQLPAEALRAIDDAIGDVAERDPEQTAKQSPNPRA